MKILFLFILIFLNNFYGGAQSHSQIIGKISYESDSKGLRNSIIDCWFSNSDYFYEYRGAELVELGSLSVLKELYKKSADSINADSAFQKYNRELLGRPHQRWFGHVGTSQIIHKWFDANTKIYYCIKDSQDFVDWTILSETDSVEGMYCQRALGEYRGMKYSAWFTTDIPVTLAPLQFRGLPGLMIKCKNETLGITMKMINLQWPLKELLDITPVCEPSSTVTKLEFSEILAKEQARLENIRSSMQKKLDIKN